ncbi:MAG: prephenate dehydratase [Vezdaea aestivalis]|nr:MAG: prephenate dehydratase [Vezdaea aestivalis]
MLVGPANVTDSLSNSRHVYSHPQALGQCAKYISTNLPNVELHEVSSTSRAAEIVMEDSTGLSVAITSRAAAEFNHLEVLAENIEDSEDNTTRFFVIEKLKGGHEEEASRICEEQPTKSLLSFTIDHSRPGALADALLVFKAYNLNLSSIFPRPSGLKAWNYIFLVEVQARSSDDLNEVIRKALKDLERTAQGCTRLGTYVNAQKR